MQLLSSMAGDSSRSQHDPIHLQQKMALICPKYTSLAIIIVIYAPQFINCACGTYIDYPTLKVMSYNINDYNRDIPAAAVLIFYNNHFSLIKAHILDDSGGFDHYAVVAELNLLQ
jgi:hypothetical protein